MDKYKKFVLKHNPIYRYRVAMAQAMYNRD